VVSVVISQAAATSFIHMQVLATTEVSQSMRNTGTDSGARGERAARWAALSSSVAQACSAFRASMAAAASSGDWVDAGGAAGKTLWALSWGGCGGMFRHCAASGPTAQHLPQRPGADQGPAPARTGLRPAAGALPESAESYLIYSIYARTRARCVSGRAPLAFTSPSEKLVCMSFTLGRLSSTSRANNEKLSRSRATTCSSKVPVPLM